MFSSATQPPPPPPRHYFIVSAITSEGFKLHSSNMTHALLIQISRTSSIIDIVVPSKMAAGGHFVNKIQKKKEVAYRSEMDLSVFVCVCVCLRVRVCVRPRHITHKYWTDSYETSHV